MAFPAMNRKQRTAILAGVVIVLALALCPPWKWVVFPISEHYIGLTLPLGSCFLFTPPQPLAKYLPNTVESFSTTYHGADFGSFGVSVDFGRLFLYWLVVVGMTGVVVYALRERKGAE